jgi:hypothetical protein
MSKAEQLKEYIGALKTYLAIFGAMLLGLGAGLSKLLLDGQIGILFWVGCFLSVVFIFLFIIVAKAMHRDIKKLEDL